uniref:Phospholipase A2 n=1 Tax=Ciona intestinalis TaxID=7719 RepID=F6TAH6_CIOIN
VKVLRCRNVSISYFQDMLDTPDPCIHVSCPAVNQKYSTIAVDDSATAEINEKFQFVFPENSSDSDFLIKVRLLDEDIVFDDVLGEKVFDAAQVELGSIQSETLDFDGNGKVDLEISRLLRETPDLRYSFGLHEKEKEFRRRRLMNVREALQKILQLEPDVVTSPDDTPVISLVGSGGGYRAIIGMCGAMEAFRDAGISDAFTYVSGISGSAWYLYTAYALSGMHDSEIDRVHKSLRRSMKKSLYRYFFNLPHLAKHTKLSLEKVKHGLPATFVDFFGFSVGQQLLKEKVDSLVSELVPYVEDGKVPYPIFVSMHVKSDTPTSQYNAYMEITPHEVAFPEFGMGFSPDTCGSVWNGGFLARKCPELPLHFHMGCTGNAFGIILKNYIDDGGEESASFVDFIDLENLKSRATNLVRRLSKKIFDAAGSERRFEESVNERLINDRGNDQGKQGIETILVNKDRTSFIGRVGKIFNFAYNFNSIKSTMLNPLAGICTATPSEEEETTTTAAGLDPISTSETTISLCDAVFVMTFSGILKNVCTEPVIRPQRFSDLVLVIDCSSNDSDSSFDYMSLLQSAEHAKAQGIKFPPIDFKKIANSPPKEFQVFESNEDDCPTVLWFTLCNKGFRNLKDYQPRSTATPPDDKPFNDFPVFDEGNSYKTHYFSYTDYHFDQLRELMYHNVMSNIEEVKVQLRNAIAKKKRRLNTHDKSYINIYIIF